MKGGAGGGAFYVPAEEETDKVLVIVHEWWGLNDYIKREAETGSNTRAVRSQSMQ